ncbi:MAG: hypothetical protein Q7V57_13635 [Actinomycetota bacterium]|nr:hypothetical protein [Actinomycetota bacterium]
MPSSDERRLDLVARYGAQSPQIERFDGLLPGVRRVEALPAARA